jgi:hypothetical protein
VRQGLDGKAKTKKAKSAGPVRKRVSSHRRGPSPRIYDEQTAFIACTVRIVAEAIRRQRCPGAEPTQRRLLRSSAARDAWSSSANRGASYADRKKAGRRVPAGRTPPGDRSATIGPWGLETRGLVFAGPRRRLEIEELELGLAAYSGKAAAIATSRSVNWPTIRILPPVSYRPTW